MTLGKSLDVALKHKFRAVFLIILIFFLIGLGLAWRWTALGEYLDSETLGTAFRSLRLPEKPWLAIITIVLASIAAVPLGLIIGLAALLFGPVRGPIYVLLGASIGAAISFAIGKHLGHEALKLFAGSRIKFLSEYFGQKGFVSVLILRLVPVAPFAIANMVAGSSHIRWRDFMAATIIGMLPGILAITVFIDRIVDAIRYPGWQTGMISIGFLLAIVVAIIGLRSWGRDKVSKSAEERFHSRGE